METGLLAIRALAIVVILGALFLIISYFRRHWPL